MASQSRIGSRRFSFESNDSFTSNGTPLREMRSAEDPENDLDEDQGYRMTQHSLAMQSMETISSEVTDDQQPRRSTCACVNPHVSHQCSAARSENFIEGQIGERFSGRLTALPSRLPPRTVQIHRKRKVLREIWLSLTLTVCPMLIAPTLYAVLVIKYRVEPERSLFSEGSGAKQSAYVLLNVPSTWVVFISSRASQVASLLAGPMMTLWTWRATESMLSLSTEAEASRLPNPYELSLLVGICMTSLDALWDLILLRCFRRRKNPKQRPLSPVLVRAGWILNLTLFLSLMVLAADTVLHYTTSTINLDDFSVSTQLGQSGRGLSETCLHFNRSDNSGYPCSRNIGLSILDYDAYLKQQNEMFDLRKNKSRTSEIRLAPTQSSEEVIAMLLPKSSTLSPFVDFRASTIGISTHCKSITERCDFGVWGANDSYSGFYCSPYFYGALGKTAVIANDSTTTDDPDIPPLASKLSPALQFAYFEDESLNLPYNTRAYDLESGEVNTSLPLLPDDRLVNKVWVAVAGRIPTTSLRAGSQLATDPSFFQGPNPMLDFVMTCQYQALDVNYTWSNSTVGKVHAKSSPNGTISELYHGKRVPTSVSGTNPTLLDMLSQAAMQSDLTGFCRTWANLLSAEILAVIGGVTSPRSNLLQQNRTSRLVVKIWIPSLVWLIGCCLLYPVAGVVLAWLAIETSRYRHIQKAVEKLSVAGLADEAFPKQHEDSSNGSTVGELTGHATIRVGFEHDSSFKTFDPENRSIARGSRTRVD